MFRSIADFSSAWDYEIEATGKVFGNLTDESLSQRVTQEGRTLGRIAWHIVQTLPEMAGRTGLDGLATLGEIHRELGDGFSVTLGKDPFYVRLGQAPYRKKLNRLAKLLRKLSRSGKRPAVIYFDNEKRPDRVTVKVNVVSFPVRPSRLETSLIVNVAACGSITLTVTLAVSVPPFPSPAV